MPKSENVKANLNAQESADCEALIKCIRSRFEFLGDVNLPQPPTEPLHEPPEIPGFENEGQDSL